MSDQTAPETPPADVNSPQDATADGGLGLAWADVGPFTEGESAPVDLEATTLDEAELEANNRDAEVERLQVELAQALGMDETSEVVTCPTCQMGFIPHRLLDSRKQRRCDACAGQGAVITGSLVPENAVAMCDSCGGKGWVPDFGQPAEVAAPAEAVVGPVPDEVAAIIRNAGFVAAAAGGA